MDKELKKVVKAARARGWRQGPDGKHHTLLHPSGRKISVSMSPSDKNAYKYLERTILRVEREEEAKAKAA